MATFAYTKYNGDEIFFYNLNGDVIYQEPVHMRTAKMNDFDSCIEQYNNTIEERNKLNNGSEKKFDFGSIDVFSDHANGTYGFLYFIQESDFHQEIMKSFTIRKPVYEWILIKSVSLKRNMTIDTDWKISFDDVDNSYLMCESIESYPNFEKHSLKRPIIPLLDTILHIHKEFYCCTLEQIAIMINRGYSENFANKKFLMNFVFDSFKDELIQICKDETVPIHKIHMCNFYYTFKHSKEIPEKSFYPAISQGRRFIDVCVKPRSYVDGQMKSYGDIPYLKSHQKEDGVSFCFGPLMIRERSKCTNTYTHANDDEHYYCLDIFPGVEFEGVKYPPFYMGFKYIEDDTRDFICRGKIFDDLSVREQLILRDNYNGKILFNNFKIYREPGNFYSNFRLNDKENTVRKNLMIFIISKIPEKRPD